jgi:hypothetical protein
MTANETWIDESKFHGKNEAMFRRQILRIFDGWRHNFTSTGDWAHE